MLGKDAGKAGSKCDAQQIWSGQRGGLVSDLLGSQQDSGLTVLIETYELSDLGTHLNFCVSSPLTLTFCTTKKNLCISCETNKHQLLYQAAEFSTESKHCSWNQRISGVCNY